MRASRSFEVGLINRFQIAQVLHQRTVELPEMLACGDAAVGTQHGQEGLIDHACHQCRISNQVSVYTHVDQSLKSCYSVLVCSVVSTR